MGAAPVRVTLPDGTAVTNEQPDLSDVLSRALGREVSFARAKPRAGSSGATAEEYWPDIGGLEHRDTVTEWELPAGTFFDLAVVHVLTTATLERLRVLYPEGRFEVRRFRPNIVVANDEPGFVENNWIGSTLAIGDQVRLRISGPCPRCVMTTLAQGDLPKDPGILRAAAKNNRPTSASTQTSSRAASSGEAIQSTSADRERAHDRPPLSQRGGVPQAVASGGKRSLPWSFRDVMRGHGRPSATYILLQIGLFERPEMRRETSRMSFLMCPFCVRPLFPSVATNAGPGHGTLPALGIGGETESTRPPRRRGRMAALRDTRSHGYATPGPYR
jgi:MOSC domain